MTNDSIDKLRSKLIYRNSYWNSSASKLTLKLNRFPADSNHENPSIARKEQLSRISTCSRRQFVTQLGLSESATFTTRRVAAWPFSARRYLVARRGWLRGSEKENPATPVESYTSGPTTNDDDSYDNGLRRRGTTTCVWRCHEASHHEVP